MSHNPTVPDKLDKHPTFTACLLAWLLIWLALPAHAAVNESDLLPVDKAFSVTASPVKNGQTTLRFSAAEGYYLYRHALKFKAADANTTVGTPVIPRGNQKTDEFFGEVETYRNTMDVILPVHSTSGQASIEVHYQGCADAGVCYPPQKKTLTVPVPASTAGPQPATSSPPLPLPASGGSLFGAQPGVPSPEQAFQVEAIALDDHTLSVRFHMMPDIYLYRDKISFASEDPAIEVGKAQLPPGTTQYDEHFGEVQVYYDQVEVAVPLTRRPNAATTVPLKVSFQGCIKDGICYPPMERTVRIWLQAPKAPLPSSQPSTQTGKTDRAPSLDADTQAGSDQPLSEQDSIIQSLKNRSALYTILLFFGFGLLLTFTPCVFPMIPILSGLIAGQGKISTSRAFVLSLAYVVAMALTYTAAGVAAGLLGANIQAAFQKPWIIIVFSLVFVALAFSMFGYYDLQLPAKWQNKLSAISNKQKGGSLTGVVVMGFLSALIVGPCVAPPLAAAVLFISGTGDAFVGGLALFAMGMGMGAPLLVIGASQGKLMPQSGGWMNVVKAFFGLLLLGMAVWFLSRILPETVILALWGLLFLAAAVLWTGYAKDSGVSPTAIRFFDFLKISLLVVGIAMLVGSLMGNGDPFKPLAGLRAGQETGAPQAVSFRPVRSVEELDTILASATKPVMLDFYADWCTECKRMEKTTFRNPAVVATLQDFITLKADVTAQNAQDKALMQRFGVIGPPATLFFDKQGSLLNAYNFFGYKSADELLAVLNRVQQSAR